jgi:serine/threonine protein phosphatase PrpC
MVHTELALRSLRSLTVEALRCDCGIQTSRDKPEDGQIFSCRVEPGDVVVLASDGVFDNLYEQVSSWIVHVAE